MDPTGTGLLPLWAEAGGLAVIIVAFITGLIVSGRTLEREASRADRVEDELRRVNAYVVEELVPDLTRATVALEAARERLRDRMAADRPSSPDDWP